ncbi:MAG: fructose-1,6-bisphosphatase [Massiliimalia sp.]|jgi:fructose-1,6-bisphosphatase-3
MIDQHYLRLLAQKYPSIAAASAEIINLSAIMSLPKGTEYFFSDLHGEHQAFIHLIHSASGVIRSKIDDLFGKSISQQERTNLAALIYQPETQLRATKQSLPAEEFDEWCRITIYRLVEVCKEVASKYTRDKVRQKMPASYAYVIDELLHTGDVENKSHYFEEIINSIVENQIAEDFIAGMCRLIGQLSIDMLHIIGDIFDRGPRADMIMEELMAIHNVDIQWGNHDISWMGAAAGNWACVANVVRLGISYNTFDVLEDGYGINLRPLSVFAAQVYKDDPCEVFTPHILDQNKYDPVDISLAAKMHKAMAIIQFKVEGQLILRHPEYGMEDRLLLSKVNFADGTITINGNTYPLKDTSFPTVDPHDPLRLTPGEEELMRTLAASFRHSRMLNRHVKFLYSHGSMYKCVNSNLLYHGCIPMTEDGEFLKVSFGGNSYSGKAYLEYIDQTVRTAYFAPHGSEERHNARDFIWYLWCGKNSPLFGKSKMAAFERYFLDAKETHKEDMNPYYNLVEQREICEKLLWEFGLDPAHSHIVNGHVPVKIKQGESPVKGDGLLFIIDGGMSKAYHSKTGIGGYTFIYNSRFLALAEHQPFEASGKGNTVERAPKLKVVEPMKHRITIAETDAGQELRQRIGELKALLAAYRAGTIKEL